MRNNHSLVAPLVIGLLGVQPGCGSADRHITLLPRPGDEPAAEDGPGGGLRHRPEPRDLDPGLPTGPPSQTRSFQDIDVELPGIGAGELRIELWSDGSQEEDAGNGLRLSVGADGKLAATLRLGKELVALGQRTLPAAHAGRPLLLRVRAAGAGVMLHVDVRAEGGMIEDAALFSVDDRRPYPGLRTVLLAPVDGSVRIAVRPVMPEAAFSFDRSCEGPSDWKVYQRTPANEAAIPLSFIYRSEGPAQLVLEVLRAATSDPLPGYAPRVLSLPSAPRGRNARVSLPRVPAGGNYHVRGRLTAAADGAELGEDSLKHVAVGDVFLMAGQSNMTGFAPLHPVEPPADEVHLFGNDYRWKRAIEPMDSGEDQVDRVSEERPQHSIMLRFGKEIFAATRVPVAIIPAPRYGTNLNVDWQRNDARPEHRGTLYGSALHRVRLHGYEAPIRALLFWQGEGNVGSGTENYLGYLSKFVADMRSDLGDGDLFLGNCQLITNGLIRALPDLDDMLAIQEAQRQYAARDARSGVVALADLPRDDNWHLNNSGVKEAGRRLAQITLAGAYGLTRSLPPVLAEARFAAGRRDLIELVYDKPVVDGRPQLFTAYDARGAIAVSGVMSGTERVSLTLARAAVGRTTLSYGFSNQTGSVWLRAKDQSGAPLLFRRLPVMD